MACCPTFLLLAYFFAHTSTAGGYLLQHHTKWCSSHNILTTVEECKRAKAALDPSAAAVTSEKYEKAPKGCSRYQGNWFFNTHDTGDVDGVSEPICKATGGEPTSVRPQNKNGDAFTSITFYAYLSSFCMVKLVRWVANALARLRVNGDSMTLRRRFRASAPHQMVQCRQHAGYSGGVRKCQGSPGSERRCGA